MAIKSLFCFMCFIMKLGEVRELMTNGKRGATERM